jgi:hypothetical protein
MRSRTVTVLAVLVLLGAGTLMAKRAFEPPVPLSKMALIKPGMSEDDVRKILGPPTEAIASGHDYAVNGTNFVTGGQWTYTRFLTFGYVNVLFDTNRLVEYAHREEF